MTTTRIANKEISGLVKVLALSSMSDEYNDILNNLKNNSNTYKKEVLQSNDATSESFDTDMNTAEYSVYLQILEKEYQALDEVKYPPDILTGYFDAIDKNSIKTLVEKASQVAKKLGLSKNGKKIPLIIIIGNAGEKLQPDILTEIHNAKASLEELGFEITTHNRFDYISETKKPEAHPKDLKGVIMDLSNNIISNRKQIEIENTPKKISYFTRNPNASLYIKRGLVVLGVLAFVAAIVVGGILSGGALFALGAGAGIGIFAAAAHSAICVGAIATIGQTGAALLGVFGVAAGVMGTIFSAHTAKDLFYTQKATPMGRGYRHTPILMADKNGEDANSFNTAGTTNALNNNPGTDNKNPEAQATEAVVKSTGSTALGQVEVTARKENEPTGSTSTSNPPTLKKQ